MRTQNDDEMRKTILNWSAPQTKSHYSICFDSLVVKYLIGKNAQTFLHPIWKLLQRVWASHIQFEVCHRLKLWINALRSKSWSQSPIVLTLPIVFWALPYGCWLRLVSQVSVSVSFNYRINENDLVLNHIGTLLDLRNIEIQSVGSSWLARY